MFLREIYAKSLIRFLVSTTAHRPPLDAFLRSCCQICCDSLEVIGPAKAGVFPGFGCKTSASTQLSFWSICHRLYLATCHAHLHFSGQFQTTTWSTPICLRISSLRTLPLRVIPNIEISISR